MVTAEGQDRPEVRTAVLSGASGMLGSAIGRALEARGLRLTRLMRRTPHDGGLQWNPQHARKEFPDAAFPIGMPQALDRLEGVEAAIHLSGANVAGRRWTEAYKREMTESRVQTTRVLAQTLARLKHPPSVLLAASAIGFYGDRGDAVVDEASGAGHGYFPELCEAWEEAAQPAADAGIRVVHLRFAMVLGSEGGALARLAPMFRLGLGGKLGDGLQWMSWVSEADAVGAALFALGLAPAHPAASIQAQDQPGNANLLSGPVNVTSPQPVTNAEFTRLLGHAVHRPAIVNAPAFALRLAFGEMADQALLASTRAVPTRLLQAGYRFLYPSLEAAFKAAL